MSDQQCCSKALARKAHHGPLASCNRSSKLGLPSTQLAAIDMTSMPVAAHTMLMSPHLS